MSSPFLTRCLLVSVLTVSCAFSQMAVTTHHYDNSRTGGNTSEDILTASNVNPSMFGMLFSYPVDGDVYAQPLYVPSVTLANGSTHNVLYIETMNNSVYAFDADTNAGTNSTPLWTVNYNNPALGITPVPATDVQIASNFNIIGPIGITGTPVIDTANSAMYFVVRTKENGAYFQRLHAVNIATGAELGNSPVVITGSVSGSKGTTSFDTKINNQRLALALANGMVYIAWASHGDSGAYHGWVMGYSTYSASSPSKPIQQQGIFCDTYGGSRGGLWQSGSGPVIDSNGNLYYGIGNGTWDGVNSFAESVVKLSPTLQVVDYFTPYNWSGLTAGDLDLGVGGVLMIPGTDLMVETSKTGLLYLLSTSNLGHLVSGNTQIPQVLSAAPGHIHSGPTYWNSPTFGPLVYVWGEQDYLKAFHFNGTTFDTTPVTTSTFKDPTGMPGAFLAVSSNGSVPGTGVLWANLPYSGNANTGTVPGVLRAFSPDNLSIELWDSHIDPTRDDYGNFSKFTPPMIVNGKVYMATFSNQVVVYGLLPTATTINETLSTNSLTLVPGGNSSIQVNIASTGTLPAPISLTLSGVPSGVNAQLDTTTFTSGGIANLALSVTTAAASGTYTINVVAQSGPFSVTHAITLVVETDPVALRIDAGGSGVGAFAADVDYSGGGVQSTKSAIKTANVVNPAPQSVYQSSRYQNTTYTIPNLTAGNSYLVRLHFAETYFTTTGQRMFNVAINGTPVLTNFDIVAAAGAGFTAVVEPFTAVANSSGQIVIAFTKGKANYPQINGIEIIQSVAVQINAGGGAAGPFAPDQNFSGGLVASTGKPINTANVLNPAPQQVYQSNRYQNVTYTIPNLNIGENYTVRLHFAELYFTTPGSRKFNVAINGTAVLQNFDIVAAAGAAYTAVVEQFPATPDSGGSITIALTKGSANYPEISGIEVL